MRKRKAKSVVLELAMLCGKSHREDLGDHQLQPFIKLFSNILLHKFQECSQVETFIVSTRLSTTEILSLTYH